MKKSCIIIGAGISGLIAADMLVKNNWEVTILDKSRGVGGRMATRRIAQAKFDHGTQYFSAKTSDFQEFIGNIIRKNIAKEWHIESRNENLSSPRIIGIGGMSNIPKFLAQSLSIKTNEKVIDISETKIGYKITTESGNFYEAKSLISTIPAPQAIELLQQSSMDTGTEEIDKLQQIYYQPCIAVMASLNAPTNIPNPGGINFENASVAWLADNFQKGISPVFSATIHANSAFSLAHFGDDLTQIGRQILSEAEEFILPKTIESYQVHRWRYSLPEKRYPDNYLLATKTNFPLIFAGDGFGVGNIEGAYISGKNAAQKLISCLTFVFFLIGSVFLV